MAFEVKDLLWAKDALRGISEKTIETHHDKLYAGYVNKRNEIESLLPGVDRSAANQAYSAYRALKLEETFSADGAILHELYFDILGGPGGAPTGSLADKINADFGSFEAFVEDLTSCGMAARGWAVTAYDPLRRQAPQLPVRRTQSGRRVGHGAADGAGYLRACLLHGLRLRPGSLHPSLLRQRELGQGAGEPQQRLATTLHG